MTKKYGIESKIFEKKVGESVDWNFKQELSKSIKTEPKTVIKDELC